MLYLSDNTTNSYWSYEASFKTLCENIDLAYTQKFDESIGDATPDCWYVNQELIGSVYKNYYPSVQNITRNNVQTKALKMDSYYATEDVNGYEVISGVLSFAVLPYFADTIQNMFIQFSNYSSTEGAKLKVGVVTNPSEPSSFELIDEITLGNWQQNSVSFANYTDDINGYIAFVFDGIANEETTSVYIDDITVDYV